MSEKIGERKKELLNAYWYALIISGIIGIVNLFAISKDNLKAAAVVNLVFLILIPIIFIAGYIDYRNFAPLNKKKEIVYCATAVISLWIMLTHFNVQNYTFMSQYIENTYNIWVSALTALYLAIGFICVSLSVMNSHNRKKQSSYYYAVAFASVISSIFLTAFNYATTVTLFWAPLRLMKIYVPLVVDTGMTILVLRVLLEYFIFIIHARQEKKGNLLLKGEESEYRPELVKMSKAALAFMLVNLLLLPLIGKIGELDYNHAKAWFYVYEVVEFLSVTVLLSLGTAIAFRMRKSEKYGQIYLRMGIASIVFALVYLIMDFFPIVSIVKPAGEIQAKAVSDIFHASVKMAGLLFYTLYVALNKKLNETIHKLDLEHEERCSSENYSI